MNKIKILISLVICFMLPTVIFANGQNESTTADGKTTVNLWHIYTTDVDAQKVAMDRAIDKFEAENPDIKIVVDTTETEAFKTKLRTAIAANEAPDLFITWGGGFSKPFAESGNLLDLTPYMNQYGANLNKATLNNATYNGKVNGLTFTSNLAVLYCNTELFENYNVKLPETYQDLVEAVKVFRANGITPLSVGEQAMWPGMFHYATMAIREGGVDLTLKALEGEESFNQAPFIEAANKLLNLVRLGAFNDGAAGIDVDQAMAVAQNGQAAMIYQGNWAASGFDSSDVKGKIVPLKWPTVQGGKGNNDALGGAVDMISAAANSKDSDITARAAFGIAENFSLTGYELGSFITTWDSSDVDSSQLPDLFKQITELNQTYDNYQMWWDTFLGGEKAQSVLNLIARLFIDDITAEEFVVEMDAAVR